LWVQLIWSFIGLIFLVFTPETYAPIIVAKNKMRDSPKDGQEHHTEKSSSISAVIAQNITKIPLLLLQDIMLLLLCLWTALLLGIVYLFFELFREYREGALVLRRDTLADTGLMLLLFQLSSSLLTASASTRLASPFSDCWLAMPSRYLPCRFGKLD
jgi:hypothetical protein